MFLAEFMETSFGYSGSICGTETDMEKFVCLGIDGSVQPVLLIGDANHTPVKRNLIRSCPATGL